jgi:alpha-tubulin suppressor-like RCC1 family protein
MILKTVIRVTSIILLVFLFFYSSASVNALVPNVISVSIGEFHGLALKNDGTVWVWGVTYPGRAGKDLNGALDATSIPVQIPIGNVTMISAGSDYNLALKDDGTVWAWGYNDFGQLGDGTNSDSAIPVMVKTLDNITEISAGTSHCLALRRDGTVWTWGSDHYGEIDGKVGSDINNKNIPVQVNISGVKAISTGNGYSVALKDDGTVWTWGSINDNLVETSNNVNGQLVISSNISTATPYPIQVPDLSNVIQISASSFQILALDRNGNIWEWGDIWIPVNGVPTEVNVADPKQVSNLTDIIQISAGLEHSMALKSDGTVWTWGTNDEGQLGIGETDMYTTEDPLKIPTLQNIISIAASEDLSNSAAIGNDGTVFEWGRNYDGQIDPNSTTMKFRIPNIILQGTGMPLKIPSASTPYYNTSSISLHDNTSNQIIKNSTVESLIIAFFVMALIIVGIRHLIFRKK